MPGTRTCINNAPNECSGRGVFEPEPECSAGSPVCVGEGQCRCRPGTTRCAADGAQPQVCNASYQWVNTGPSCANCTNGRCGGEGCSGEQRTTCGMAGCNCASGLCAGGFCEMDGCTAERRSVCAGLGCGCVDGGCSGGFCAGDGCTARAYVACDGVMCGCKLQQCTGGACQGSD